MERRNIPFSLDAMEQGLNDIAGVRVICAFPEDVNTMANTFLQQDDVVLLQKKDYITNPKPNGYRSLHLIIAIPVHLADGKHPYQSPGVWRTSGDSWTFEYRLLEEGILTAPWLYEI